MDFTIQDFKDGKFAITLGRHVNDPVAIATLKDIFLSCWPRCSPPANFIHRYYWAWPQGNDFNAGDRLPEFIDSYVSIAPFMPARPLLPTDEAIRPEHYNQGKIEVADFINDQNLNFNRGNAVKYVCRAGAKDPDKEIQDLEKVIMYIKFEICRLKDESVRTIPR